MAKWKINFVVFVSENMEYEDIRYAVECKQVWLSRFNFAWSLQLCHTLIM
jgi:hypothetical protein